jgi:hypothetical protein
LLLPQVTQAHGGAQPQCSGLLPTGDNERLSKGDFCLPRIRWHLPQYEFPHEPMEFSLPPAFPSGLHGGECLSQGVPSLVDLADAPIGFSQ